LFASIVVFVEKFTQRNVTNSVYHFCFKEKHALIEEWQPEPLIPEVEEENPFGFKNKFTG